MNSSQNINPKNCSYGCNTRIYWNTLENAYFEVFSGNRHQCPNRSNKSTNTTNTTTSKPNYFNKFAKYQPTTKPKMDNSFELLQGPIQDIQKKYEYLSDLVRDYNGKVHGSQSHIDSVSANNNSISLIVYYEVPEGKREEVKERFNI